MHQSHQIIDNPFPIRTRLLSYGYTASLLLLVSMLSNLGQTSQPALLKAQWVATAGGPSDDYPWGVAVDSTGNSYVTGWFSKSATFGNATFSSIAGTAMFLAKYDPSGKFLWARQAPSTKSNEGHSVVVDPSGNVYLAGIFEAGANFGTFTVTSKGGDDIFLAKYDPNGNVLWVKQAGGAQYDSADKLGVDARGNVFLAGGFSGTAAFGNVSVTSKGSFDCYLAKYNGAGDAVWVSTGSNAGADSLSVASDGSIYLTGSFSDNSQFGNIQLRAPANARGSIFVARFDSDGKPLWVIQGTANAGEAQLAVAATSQGGAYLTGTFYGTAQFDTVSVNSVGSGFTDDVFLFKFDAAGKVLWANQYGDAETDFTQSLVVDRADNVFIAGASESSGAVVAKFDSTGNFLGARAAAVGPVLDIALGGTSTLYLTGSFEGSDQFAGVPMTSKGGEDIYVAKISWEDVPPQPPTINQQPQSQSVFGGSTVTFSVNAIASGLAADRFIYQWRKDKLNLVGATNSTYTIINVQTTNAGAYSVVVSNPYGNTTSSDAMLTVKIAPANDLFVSRIAIRGLSATVTGSNIGATLEKDEPAYGPNSVWWTWFAPTDGAVFFNTSGSSFNPLLFVFTGSAVTNLTRIDIARDSTTSNHSFWATAGTSYHIAVYGADGVTGQVVLDVRMIVDFTFSTFAGIAPVFSADGLGSNARFYLPLGVAVDGAGNVYVADGPTLRKITPAGIVTTPAGNPTFFNRFGPVSGYVDGPGTNALFLGPTGVAMDSAGNAYVADVRMIRKITPAGLVSTLAGNARLFGSVDGLGGNALFGVTAGIAVDSAGNVYVADQYNCTIRKVMSTGVVTTLAGKTATSDVAGNRIGGYADGVGSNARFDHPSGVAVDNAGNVYVTDQNNFVIRKVTPAGLVSTLAGQAGSPGNIDGFGNSARFGYPSGVALDSAGNLYVADNVTIRMITPSGLVTTLAGNASITNSQGYPISGFADGVGNAARFNFPNAVAVDGSGIVYVADTYNQSIRKITKGGGVSTLAGVPPSEGSTDGSGSLARFNNPNGVALDNVGNVYVADTLNNTIRKITAAGLATTLAGNASSNRWDNGRVIGGYADGPGDKARFDSPSALAADSLGNVYVVDRGNSAIRKITPGGVVSTFCRRVFPAGVAMGGIGDVYVAYGERYIDKITQDGVTVSSVDIGTSLVTSIAADSLGNVYAVTTSWIRLGGTIWKITPSGVVGKVAGNTSAGSEDGTGDRAQFNDPTGIAVDSAGNIYVTDTYNSTIRQITPAGTVRTVAGWARDWDFDGFNDGGYADGTGRNVRFNYPNGVAVDSSGNLYVADSLNNTIRKGVPSTIHLEPVAPGLSLLAHKVGSEVKFQFSTVSGLNYTILHKSRLEESAWSVLETRPGTGATIEFPRPTNPGPNGFFRVRVD